MIHNALAIARPEARTQPHVAVVLNGNARSVNDALIGDLRRMLVDEALFVSRSLDQARFIARQIVNQKYDVVLCGGGDGTFTRVVSDVMALGPRQPPAFGVIRLGTGNALADALGTAPAGLKGIADELRQARCPDARVPLALLKVEGQLTPFCGLGVDAMILEDYVAIKQQLAKTPFEMLGQGTAGYGLAVATRSLWRLMLNPLPRVTIVNEGLPARPVDLWGRPTGPAIARGEVLYRGPISIAAASTVPFYGMGLRLFPQSCLRPDRFQLRVVGAVPAYELVSQIPQIFSGEFNHEKLWDFSCTAISVHCEAPTPFQIGGDVAGRRKSVHLGMVELRAVAGASGVIAAPAPGAERPELRAVM